MRKLVVLKLDGDLEVGVRVTLEIGCEGFRPSTEISGQLPPNPNMATSLERWQSTYGSLWKFTRIKAKKIICVLCIICALDASKGEGGRDT